MYLENIWDVLGEDIRGIQQHFCVAKKEFYRVVRHTRAVVDEERDIDERERERERER